MSVLVGVVGIAAAALTTITVASLKFAKYVMEREKDAPIDIELIDREGPLSECPFCGAVKNFVGSQANGPKPAVLQVTPEGPRLVQQCLSCGGQWGCLTKQQANEYREMDEEKKRQEQKLKQDERWADAVVAYMDKANENLARAYPPEKPKQVDNTKDTLLQGPLKTCPHCGSTCNAHLSYEIFEQAKKDFTLTSFSYLAEKRGANGPTLPLLRHTVHGTRLVQGCACCKGEWYSMPGGDDL